MRYGRPIWLCGFVALVLLLCIGSGLMAGTGQEMTQFEDRLLIWNVLASGHQRGQAYLDLDRYFETVARLGYTAVEVNALSTLEVIQQDDPGDHYPLFNIYSPALDQFAESSLIRGLYPKEYLQRNLEELRGRTRLARRHGLKTVFSAYEPRWVPESFYKQHPELRGPRSDHPGRSRHARYSLCVDRPEVLQHYSEMVSNLLRDVPGLDYFFILPQDSGAAFCWAAWTYAGPNGSEYCRAIPVAQRIQKFLEAWRSGIAKSGSKAKLIFWPQQFNPEEREPLIEKLPQDVALAFDAHEGASVQIGGKTFGVDRYAAWTPDFGNKTADFVRRADRAGRKSYILDTFDYGMDIDPILGLPMPYIAYERLENFQRNGVKHFVNFGGIVSPPAAEAVAGQEVLREYVQHPDGSKEQTVRRVAERLAGPKAAEPLLRAWQILDEAIRKNPTNFAGRLGPRLVWWRFLARPLVVAPAMLTDEEKSYFSKVTFLDSIDHAWTNFFWEANRRRFHWEEATWTVEQYDRLTQRCSAAIEEIEQALALSDDAKARTFLQTEGQKIGVYRCVLTTIKNILRAQSLLDKHQDFYKDSFVKDAARDREEFVGTVLNEIANTGELRALLQQARGPLIAQSHVEENVFIYGMDLAEQLRRKVEVMRRHLPEANRFFGWRE